MRFWLGILFTLTLTAATRTEYRGFWVDTFNSNLNSHADVVAVVRGAKSAQANTIFAQVRRRGDAWYLNSLEPPPDFVPIEARFDPLLDLIQEAHAQQMEVHAFVILGAIWNKNPTFPASATLGAPTSPNHVFNRHGGFDATTGRIEAGPNNWLTRSLLPDGTAGISFQGHRFGSDFWLDFGHPEAATYTVEVLLHLVRNYNLDGLHLDRIRYPEFAVAGQSVATGANIGYNAVSVARFQAKYGLAPDAPSPAPGDERWSQWRRDQVTNLVRRIYLQAIALRPQLTISAALIAFGDGPASEAAWKSADAYWRVYQDWRAWTEEGFLDLAIPMNYKREHIPQQAAWYRQWNDWTRNHRYSRGALMGLGIYLNSVEGTVRQIESALAPPLLGVAMFSLAVPDGAVEEKPVRGLAELAAALTKPEGIFFEPATIPALAWKVAPARGHLMGFAGAVDSAEVAFYNEQGQVAFITATDGSGFFGAVDLPAGRYVALVEWGGERKVSRPVEVVAGKVGLVGFD